jgi:hypothetical protein
MTRERTIAIAITFACLGGCQHDNKTGQLETTGATVHTTTGAHGTPDPNEPTIERFANVRCAHELTCNNIGAGKKWTDEAACRREVRQNVHADFRQSECHTILADKLQACVDAIHDERCDVIIDFTRVTACRKGNICKD